jgi:hypothetical protein
VNKRVKKVVLLTGLLVALMACDSTLLKGKEAVPELCSVAWYEYMEEKIAVADEHGHGPDVGSSEWRYSVEHKLGVAGSEQHPLPQSEAWCAYIQSHIGQ